MSYRLADNTGPVPPTGYLPIEEHGIVGDLRTVALVGTDGTVDWYCPSRFDAPSLFGALLDARKGGYFSLWCRGSWRPKQLYLPDTALKVEESGVAATFTLEEGQGVDIELEWNGEVRPLAAGETEELFTRTSDFWQSWVSQSRYRGRWREMVQRSALVLKLLVYHPTGALVAAPTTSLPEQLGGGRNWDYRYSWLRDAAFTVYALMTLGFLEEAASFMEWVQRRCETATAERDVMIMYTVDGSEDLEETILDHLDGYQGSRPVRIGNSAVGQRQLDVYGELMDSVYLYNREVPISYDLWTGLCQRLDWLARHWQEPDEGIWEIRGPRQRFYANHLGLYAEQIGASGEALGNFPQAFTHLALISAAVNLDRALDR